MPKLTPELVKAFFKLTKGTVDYRVLHGEFLITTPEGKNHLRQIMARLVTEDFVERVGKQDGVFRMRDATKAKIAWQDADAEKAIPLKLPFEIDKYIVLFNKNLIVIAGEVNSGKTAFLYNVAWMNQDTLPIEFYTNNEASPQEIKKRLSGFDPPCKFPIYERYDNWADIIDPDKISIIDYLEMGGEALYLVSEEMNKIQQRLNTGIAVLGLQLPPATTIYVKGQKKQIHRDLGYGGGFSAMKASLYISLWKTQGDNEGIAKLVKVKNRRMPLVSPQNMQFKFTIDNNGAKFSHWEQYTGEENIKW